VPVAGRLLRDSRPAILDAPADAERLFRNQVTALSGTAATITTCDDASCRYENHISNNFGGPVCIDFGRSRVHRQRTSG
jgi:uncharacterized heparinase superfamily protein